MCTRIKHDNIDFLQNTKKGIEKGKANIYCFYEINLSFQSIQGEKAHIFFNLIRTLYVKGPLRMLRPGGKI